MIADCIWGNIYLNYDATTCVDSANNCPICTPLSIANIYKWILATARAGILSLG